MLGRYRSAFRTVSLCILVDTQHGLGIVTDAIHGRLTHFDALYSEHRRSLAIARWGISTMTYYCIVHPQRRWIGMGIPCCTAWLAGGVECAPGSFKVGRHANPAFCQNYVIAQTYLFARESGVFFQRTVIYLLKVPILPQNATKPPKLFQMSLALIKRRLLNPVYASNGLGRRKLARGYPAR